MKTELIHSYSSNSLPGLVRDESFTNLNATGGDHLDGAGGQGPPQRSRLGHFFQYINGQICRRKTLERKLPIIRWLPEYSKEKLVADIIAGLTVGLTILPQGLSYATVAGLPPQYGLYSGFVGCFVYILLGGTREVTIGPTAIMAIITYTYTRGKPPDYAVILCFLTGIMTTIMGVFNLGFIVNFISTPVNSGFTSAAALTICSTQVKGLLGLKFPAEGFLPTLRGAIAHMHEASISDSLLSAGCITSLIILMKLSQIVTCCIGTLEDRPILGKCIWFTSTSRNALVIVILTIVVSSMGSPSIFHIVGNIQPGLPDFTLPPFNIIDPSTNETHSFLEILEEEGSALIVLPLLAIMEHITIAKAFQAQDVSLDASQEMVSIGVSNLVGSFFSSMPITGSFSRTTVNAMSGARSPMGGLVTGTIVILALRFLTPYFTYIPKAGLASVIVCAVITLIDYEVIKPMWRSKKMEFVPWGLTFIVSLFVGLEFGMMTGFVISVIYLLYYAARPGVKVMRGFTSRATVFILVELDRSLTFPSVEYIRYVIGKSSTTFGYNQVPMVIDCHHITFADFTAAQGLRELVKSFYKRDQQIFLWKVKPSVVRVLEGVGKGHHCFVSSEQELEERLDKLDTINGDNNTRNLNVVPGVRPNSKQSTFQIR